MHKHRSSINVPEPSAQWAFPSIAGSQANHKACSKTQIHSPPCTNTGSFFQTVQTPDEHSFAAAVFRVPGHSPPIDENRNHEGVTGLRSGRAAEMVSTKTHTSPIRII